ncbi:ATP-binding protein [uncultured Dialister sp.]|uniref:ATP-binding protein n=1 Tax=uncultured Dialister sp. TaxID=278064 RepID=UPI0025F47556|nr:ATP-binding protein [uncultured Dialister sp.]
MKVYKRENYLKRIRGFYHDTEIIKVITGIRRCGKSCLMQSIADELIAAGIPSENVIYLNLDKREYQKITASDDLDALIEQKTAHLPGVKYLFIDEIQNVKDFELVINGYREEGDISIFITVSNSYLLSGELATKLTGRYLEFELYTLSFEEYLGMKQFLGKPLQPDLTGEFDLYLAEGGFPKALQYEGMDKQTYVQGVIQEIFEKDIRKRVKIRKVSVFDTVQRFIINNFGSTMSLTNMLDDLRRNGCEIKRETLNRYITILEDAKIIYPCRRFDLKSRKSIAGEQKYYVADLGLYYALNTDARVNYGPAMENVVFIYAKSKGYKVSVGRIGKLECDFILNMANRDYAYVQVAMTIMSSRETEDREYRPFEKIRDNYPKYLMTRNDLIQQRDGIRHVNAPSFMKDNRLFI